MGIFGTSSSVFADISIIIEALILLSFAVGVSYARKHAVDKHYKIMTVAFIANLVFVGVYMIRSLIQESSQKFSGSVFIKDFVYIPTAVVHGIASLAAFALAGYTVYYGYTRTSQKKIRTFKAPGIRSTHRTLGILTLSTWTLSFFTGIAVYLLLYVLY